MCPDISDVRSDRYSLGRNLSMDEALMLTRRATFDPGQFTRRVLYAEGEPETLGRWQARAVLVALAATEPDERWASVNRQGPHITEYERVEMARVLAASDITALPSEDADQR